MLRRTSTTSNRRDCARSATRWRSRTRWHRRLTCSSCRLLRSSRTFGLSSSDSPSVGANSLWALQRLFAPKCDPQEKVSTADTLARVVPTDAVRSSGECPVCAILFRPRKSAVVFTPPILPDNAFGKHSIVQSCQNAISVLVACTISIRSSADPIVVRLP
jgi:hypothetical protein